MRRIKKANIRFISLCPKGANKLDVLYKSDGSVEFSTLIKASDSFDEHGELTAVVYAPEHRDSQGDIASAEVIKEAAHDFISNGAHIDINHNGKPLKREQARVAETFIIQKNDPRFDGWKDTDGNDVDLADAWGVVLKIDDPELRKLYRSGGWQGVSMGGTAVVEAEKSDPLERIANLLSNFHTPNQTQEPDMKPEEIAKAMEPATTQLAELTKAVTALVALNTPRQPTAEEIAKKAADDAAAAAKAKEIPEPVYRGKPDDLRALEKHARLIQLHDLKKSVDWRDPASIREYGETVAALKAEWKEIDEAEGIVDEEPTRKSRPAGPAQSAGGTSTVAQALADAATLADEINKARVPTLKAV